RFRVSPRDYFMSRGCRRDASGRPPPLTIGRGDPISERRSPVMSKALWVVQGVLAVAFLVAGIAKLMSPDEVLAAATPLPVLFVKFIAVCEVLGAFGMILPGVFKIRPGLTPLAAAGLVLIMIGATAINAATLGVAMALPTFVLGVLAAFVVYGRWIVPQRAAAQRPATYQPAS
ncbi:MAG TPA: DoxX family protein, partial [Thermomicrobiales bacterium]|nr:DoxX family protein [Thermomicrobiales bacterium]